MRGMERKEWTLGADDAGRRLDRLLRRLLAKNSQGEILAALRKGLVKLNGKKAQASSLTQEGDVLSAAAFLLAPDENLPEERKSATCPYPIIFKNEHLLFIDKPAGVSVHGQGSVAEYFAGQKTEALAFVPAPLHRLDKGTSGLLAVSQSMAGARWFSEKIKSHEIKKYYWGIAEGRLQKECLWEDRLAVQETREGFFTPQAGQDDGAAAKTIAKPLKAATFGGKEISLVQYQIFTGRKRQIRAQSAFHGFPLLGDKAYGSEGKRFFLHSMRMEFPDNDLGLPRVLEAPVPQDFLAFFND